MKKRSPTRRENYAGSISEFLDEHKPKRRLRLMVSVTLQKGLTFPDGKRRRTKRMPPGTTREKADDTIKSWLEKAAGDPRLRPRPLGGETFTKWFERRCDARRERLSSVRDDEGRFRTWVAPFVCPDGVKLGDKPMASITPDDLESLVEHLDSKVAAGELSWKTSINVWAVITGSFRDACRSKVKALRVRKDNPAADLPGPDRGAERAKVFLYPSELAAFLASPKIPHLWRRLVAVAIYIGARAGELEALEWGDIDLPHGKVTLHRSIDRDEEGATKSVKDQEPRAFGVEPNLMPILKAMHKESRGKGRVFPDFPRHRDLAENLRTYLKLAGVKRPELYVSDATRLNLRFHDLRASTVTWMAVRGDSAERIMQRVGHEDWPTMKKYLRTAEALAESFGEVFGALPGDLLRISFANRKEGKNQRGGRDSNSDDDSDDDGPEVHESTAKQGESDPEGAVDRSPESDFSDPLNPTIAGERSSSEVDAALASAITKASAAGRWEVVTALAGELAARRINS